LPEDLAVRVGLPLPFRLIGTGAVTAIVIVAETIVVAAVVAQVADAVEVRAADAVADAVGE